MFSAVKHIVLFCLFCYNSSFFAQLSTAYYYDASSSQKLNEVVKQPFTPFQKKINKGLNYGNYWIKIAPSEEDYVLKIPSARITQVTAYTMQDSMNTLKHQLVPAFSLPENETVYLKVTCRKEAYIPTTIYETTSFTHHLQNHFMINGLYYGFAIMVLILNLFYFFTFRQATFLYYGLFLLSISLALFYRDGLLPLITSSNWWTAYGEIPIHIAIIFFGTLFASTYLQHTLYFPKLIYSTMVMIGISVFFYVMYLFTGNYDWFAYGELMAISVLIVYWLSGVLLFFKNTYSKFFAIAYSLILVLAFDFFISPLFGLPNIGITTGLLKIGGVFEMLILSYAVVFRMNALNKEHKKIQQDVFSYISQLEQLEMELEKLKKGENSVLTSADLSAREIEILTLIADGKTNKEIAELTHISVNTVKYHTKKLYEKLDIGSRREARKKAAAISLSTTT